MVAKIDRVSYGLLSQQQIARDKMAEYLVPHSRSITAVPFVGKDVPSERSEFAHPDIVISPPPRTKWTRRVPHPVLIGHAASLSQVISLTILAFRYEGIRRFELRETLKQLQRSLWEEEGPYAKRRSARQFVEWVNLAGGRVRGTPREGEQVSPGPARSVAEAFCEGLPSPGARAPAGGWGDAEHPGGGADAREVWPLRLIDLDDDEQFDPVFALLRRLPQLIHRYLHDTIFPDVLKHQAVKISASGQELGGDMLFKRRLGFSGTPSELLPLELGTRPDPLMCLFSSMCLLTLWFLRWIPPAPFPTVPTIAHRAASLAGKCRYDRGTDGKLQHVLTSPKAPSPSRLPPLLAQPRRPGACKVLPVLMHFACLSSAAP